MTEKELLDGLLSHFWVDDGLGILQWSWQQDYNFDPKLNKELIKYYYDNNIRSI